MKNYTIIVEDFTKSLTSSLSYGSIGNRFVEIGVDAEDRNEAERLAIKTVSELNKTPINHLVIAA